MPYVTVGAVMKNYIFESQVNNGPIDESRGQTPPAISLGGGLGLRLSRDFSLKFNIQASPGVMLHPGDDKATLVWDKKSSVGLTYQLR